MGSWPGSPALLFLILIETLALIPIPSVMNTTMVEPPGPAHSAFSAEQKEYLAGFLAGMAQLGLLPYVGATSGGQFTPDPAQGGPNLAAPKEETIYGAPQSEVTKQELWKHEEHGLDCWDRILAHADARQFPNEEDTFRFRFHGLFYVAPAQKSFMLRKSVLNLSFAVIDRLNDRLHADPAPSLALGIT